MADRVTTTAQIETTKTEIKKLEQKLEKFAPASAEIEKKMQLRDITIQEMKERMNGVEDTVFADFCTSIGVANIRQYEERELRFVDQILFIKSLEHSLRLIHLAAVLYGTEAPPIALLLRIQLHFPFSFGFCLQDSAGASQEAPGI